MGHVPLDLNRGLDRRVFIEGLGAVGIGVLLWPLGGCESCREQIANRPTRRRLRVGSADVDAAIEIYKDAVSAMQALPSGDPRSWSAQSALHGTASGFNFCQHGTDHFFSWHRAYLAYFEKICQELTGESDFGLPYWNWNQDPDMHSAFLSGVLNHSRNNTSVSGSSAFSDGTLTTILGDSNFYTFSSQLEGTPHNTAHVIVGQDMVTGASPNDPIFWMHHCMVDYCWAKWNIELENDNPSDSGWNGTTWDHFVDGDGDPVEVTAGVTTLMPLLTYQYESSDVGDFAATSAAMSAAETNIAMARIRKGADVRFEVTKRVRVIDRAPVALGRPFTMDSQVAPDDFAAILESDTAKERIFASVNYAQLPPTNDFFVRLFVNLPEANAGTPIQDPHYAGSFAFFGTHQEGHEGHHPKTDFLVDVTGTLQRLKRAGSLAEGETFSMQLVAVPAGDQFVQPGAVLPLSGIELLVTPILIRE
jgi:tyrosinase